MQLCFNETFRFAVITFIDYTNRLYDRNKTQMNKPAVSSSQLLFHSFDINGQQSIDLWEAWSLEGVAGADGVAIGIVVAVAVEVACANMVSSMFKPSREEKRVHLPLP